MPEHKRFEYLAAHQLGMRMWSDIKDEFCRKFNIPETKDYGIDLVSPDFTRVTQVKCGSASVKWSDVSAFVAYSLSLRVLPMLVAMHNVKISKTVLRFIPNIKLVDDAGIIRTEASYTTEILKIVSSKNISELHCILNLVKNYKPEAKPPANSHSPLGG